MEKYGLSIEELEGQSVELLPDRIEMRRRRRGRYDCDNANVNQGVLNVPLANNSAAICFSQ